MHGFLHLGSATLPDGIPLLEPALMKSSDVGRVLLPTAILQLSHRDSIWRCPIMESLVATKLDSHDRTIGQAYCLAHTTSWDSHCRQRQRQQE